MGADASLSFNTSLLEGGAEAATAREPITWPLFHKTGKAQADKLVKTAKGDDGAQWIIDRYGWLAESKANGCALCSLVDGVHPGVPGRSFGHIVHIPNFGKIIFGEIVAYPASVHLSMIRAELGSPTSGALTMAAASANGTGFPP